MKKEIAKTLEAVHTYTHTHYILTKRIGRQSRESYSLVDVQKIVNKIKLNKYKKQIEPSSICVFLI